METALGHEPADLILRDGALIDVYSGRLLPHHGVVIRGPWIAYVGPDVDAMIGEKTRIIEAQGRVISPGYIDPHTHIANYCNISDLLKYAIPGGTTTFVTEVEAYAFALGAGGFRAFLEQVRDLPVKIFCLVPPMVTLSPAAAPLFIGGEEFTDLLGDEKVLGLGESYWQNAILPPDDRILDLIRETQATGKSVQGHAAGVYGQRLAAYAAAGAQSCHEAVSPDDILARLTSGLYTMLREGYIRRDLESIRPLIGKIDLRRCTLCTDGVDPELLLDGNNALERRDRVHADQRVEATGAGEFLLGDVDRQCRDHRRRDSVAYSRKLRHVSPPPFDAAVHQSAIAGLWSHLRTVTVRNLTRTRRGRESLV